MAATLEELRARRDALRARRADGVRSSRFGDEEVQFRSDAELAAAIADLDRQIAAAEGRRLPRIVNIRSGKGW